LIKRLLRGERKRNLKIRHRKVEEQTLFTAGGAAKSRRF
jgi:hypothetical protein